MPDHILVFTGNLCKLIVPIFWLTLPHLDQLNMVLTRVYMINKKYYYQFVGYLKGKKHLTSVIVPNGSSHLFQAKLTS